jgi:cytochrome bd-type quinol oxidase subunit 2
MSGDALVVLGCAVLVYQAWVTYRVLLAVEYNTVQKIFQIVFVWLVPFLAAVVVHVVLWAIRKRPRPRDTAFIPETESRG